MRRGVLSKISNVLLAALVLVAVFLVILRIAGGGVYAVLSGSMEPTYRTGSLLVVSPVDYNDLEIGDPITYALADDLVATHRIENIQADENEADGLWYFTKGDANETGDAAPVYYRNIIGRPIFSIPYLGYAITFLKTLPGKIVSGLAVIVLIAIGIMPLFKNKSFAKTDFSGGMNA